MTIPEQIYAALHTLAPTTPWASANNNAIPRIVFYLISGSDNGNLRGAGPQRSRYQIDCYAGSPKDADGLAAAAKVLLRAGMVIGQIVDNPSKFDVDTTLFATSFDIGAWST